MRSKDIVVGRTYYVRIPKDVDEYLYLCDSPQMPRAWMRMRIFAEVLEVGVERHVTEFTTYGGIVGTPRCRTGSHPADDGVLIRFTYNGRERKEIVPPRSIKWEVDPATERSTK